MKIGNVLIDNPVVLAPMAGVTDLPYRQIVKRMGCGLMYTEMVSSRGLIFGNDSTEELMEFLDEEHPVAIQIFGCEPEAMARAAQLAVEQKHPAIIDINMGCPTPKIVNNGDGSALMKNPTLAGAIVSAVVKTIDIPVTVKIRKGWDETHVNAVEFAQICEANGASAIAVHGRTREQFYSGQADWQIIKAVKDAVQIPIIGNGDIFTPQDAQRMFAETGCDAVMIGRGCQGNPWLFLQVSRFLETGEEVPPPSPRERINLAIQHFYRQVDYKGASGVPQMRKHLAWYLKGLPNCARIKEKLFRLEDPAEVVAVLQDYLLSLEQTQAEALEIGVTCTWANESNYMLNPEV